MTRIWLLTAVFLVVTSACGGGSSGAKTTGAAGSPMTGGSGGGDAPYCPPNAGCNCESGLQGHVNCDTMQCDCSSCPAFNPKARAAFDACGGDPTGVWRLTKTDSGSFLLGIQNSPKATLVTCPAELVSEKSAQTMLLQLAKDGSAAIALSAPERVIHVLNSCAIDCQSINGASCTVGECGICTCTVRESSTFNEDLAWAHSGGKLTLAGPETQDEVSYCVKGDVLEYQPASGSALLTLQRVHPTGVPEPCAKRPACDSPTCELGECTGTGFCADGLDQASCEKIQNCSWDQTSCHGTVPERCAFGDYSGGTPGCLLSDTAPKCTGLALECRDQPECAAKGCSFGAACDGARSNPCFVDSGVKGCTCNSNGSCDGTFDCRDVSQDHCNSAGLTGSCRYNTMGCVATPVACEALTADECESTAGCVLSSQ
jgi:hypothetical protein